MVVRDHVHGGRVGGEGADPLESSSWRCGFRGKVTCHASATVTALTLKVNDTSSISRYASGVDLAEELRYLVLAAQREGNRALTAALRAQDLTPSQAEALSVLRTAGRPLTVKEVGERLICETGSPSRLMTTLIRKGLLDASQDPSDHRLTVLSLSRAGTRAAARVAEAEGQLYAMMAPLLDSADASGARDFLRSFVAELPAGRALARRIADGG